MHVWTTHWHIQPVDTKMAKHVLLADYTARVACTSVAKYILKSILFNYCAHANERRGPRAKIEVSSTSDANRAASPASPISSLVYRSRYPRAISSLVIPTWVTERQTRSVAVMHLIYESCQLQYKVKRRKGLEGGEMTRNDLVNRFMCGWIGGVEDLVHFR
jgi:hypothetical protein